MTSSERDDQITELSGKADELMDQVSAMSSGTSDSLVRLSRVARVNRRFIIALIVSLTMDAALTILLAFGFAGLNHTSDQINKVTHRLDVAQTVQRQKALCPLYSLFLAAKSPQARDANPQGPAAYDHAFSVIEDGYKALNCAEFIKAQH